MKSFMIFWLYKIFWILILPFVYWFGHFSWAQDFASMFNDTVDIFTISILAFIAIIALVLSRNYFLRIFGFKTKNTSGSLIDTPSFFNNIYLFISVIFEKIKNFFKKK